MTRDEREHMNELCAKIKVEEDHEIFIQLVEELNRRLERTAKRLKTKSPNNKSVRQQMPIAFECEHCR
jgi:ribosome-associated translation inhibitor RaiA